MRFRFALWAAAEGAARANRAGRAWTTALLLGALALGGAAQGEQRRLQLENGDIYEGEISQSGMRIGRGLYIWANGNRYEGQFLANRMHGQGTYRWADGRTYVGGFAAGRRQGRGALSWGNGNRYDGEFAGDLMHGQGVFSWSNGNRYEGRFQRGQPSGEGRFDWATGESYRGSFANGEMHGAGAFSWPDGRAYQGQFVNGRKAGRGEYRLPNGNRYDGQFREDRREGLGTFYWRDGTIYRGQFREDKMHGYGVKQEPEGGMELQHWEQGNLLWRQPLAEEPRCRLRIYGKPWMFRDDACINGLAHGRGLAVSLDGELIVAEGRFVLGHLVAGKAQRLRLADS